MMWTFASNGTCASERRLVRLRQESTERAFGDGSAPKYNITRALDTRDLQNANLTDPFTWIAKTGDIVHAAGFKLGSDALKLVRGDQEPMEPLGGIQRTKESTVGALGNVLKGTGNILRLRLLRGGSQLGQGVLDALDIVPSFAADVLRGTSTLNSGTRLASSSEESRSRLEALMHTN